ncbi:short chain oxidoreductase [Fusarium albosuccineum]|uniref:Short chain oxidoreductase n=1 Tax=Fusarium albosuccineum TaxID=1237068 RepID=A0A8H4KSZ2_9HYPO|nr:short chain oxidoreductase [Fusarium albosuccineum]
MSSTRKPLTWLITGSSNGFGLALTRQVLASGDNVIATSHNPQRTAELVQEVEAKPNGRWIGLDFGSLDVMVNNAAYSVLGAVEDVPEDQAKAEFETNFWGA